MSADSDHDDRDFCGQGIQLILVRISRLREMFFVPSAAVKPGQRFARMFLDTLLRCVQHFFHAGAVKQFDGTLYKRIMQHVQMRVHKSRKKQSAAKVNFFFTGDLLCLFVGSCKNNFAIFHANRFCYVAGII